MTIPRVPLAIGLDLGGSKIAGGVVDASGKVVDLLAGRPAPEQNTAETLRAVLDIVAEFRQRHIVDAIGFGVAALVDWPEGRVRWSWTAGYDGLELRRLVADATGLPVVVDNDANAAAWGEAYQPGGVPAGEQLVMFCVGSGLGGGFVLNGEVFRGATGIAAEVNHLPVDGSSTEACVCGCGQFGNLGNLASGSAIARGAQRIVAADPDGLIAKLSLDGVTAKTAAEAARQGDPAARALFERMGHWLGVGAATLVTLLDVRRIVVGGGVVAVSDLYLDQMRETMGQRVFARQLRELPSIEPARLGAEATWIGAGLLALHHTPVSS